MHVIVYGALFVYAMAAFSRVSGLCVNLNPGADCSQYEFNLLYAWHCL